MTSMWCVFYGRDAMNLRAIFSLLLIFVYACGFAWFTPQLTAQSVLYAGVTTLVNNGYGTPTGVAVDASGNVYISYPYFAGGTVIQVPWTTANGYGTPANVATGLGSPFGLATDGGGNVYIAVSNTGSVVEASPAGSGSWTISTPISGLSAPKGVAVDGSGNLYVADSAGQVVVEYPWTGSNYGAPSTLVNAATSGNSSYFAPYGVAVDGSGNVFVADYGDGNGHGTLVELPPGCTIAVSGCPTQLDYAMHEPKGVAVDGSGNLFIADSNFGWILEFPWRASGYLNDSPHLPLFNQGMLVAASRYFPSGVAVDGSGNVYYSDTLDSRVEKGTIEAVDFGTVSVGSSSETIPVSFVFVTSNGILKFFLKLVPGAFEKMASEGVLKVGTGNCCALAHEEGAWRVLFWNVQPPSLSFNWTYTNRRKC